LAIIRLPSGLSLGLGSLITLRGSAGGVEGVGGLLSGLGIIEFIIIYLFGKVNIGKTQNRGGNR
jgi:hypothetical protein